MPFSKEEYTNRIEHIRDLLKDEGFHALIVSGFRNFWRDFYVRYLTGYDLTGEVDMLLFPMDGDPTLLICEPADLDRAREVVWFDGVQASTDFAQDCANLLKGHLPEKPKLGFAGGEMMGIKGFNFIPDNLCQALREGFPNAEFAAAGDILDQIRMIKSREEQELIRRSAALADKGCEALFKTARAGVSERDIFNEVWWVMQREGAEDLHLSMTSGMPNYWIRPATDRVLRPKDLIVAEICPRLDGYFTQTIKMACVGEVTREYAELFAVERAAVDAGLAQVRPGNRVKDIVKAANDVVKGSGIGTLDMGQKGIRAGHAGGIGLDETPALTIVNEMEIQAGMSLIVHPVAFFPYIGSVFFIGDHLLVTSDGYEVLTAQQKELVAV